MRTLEEVRERGGRISPLSEDVSAFPVSLRAGTWNALAVARAGPPLILIVGENRDIYVVPSPIICDMVAYACLHLLQPSE